MTVQLRRSSWQTGLYYFGRLEVWQAAGHLWWVACDPAIPTGSRVVAQERTLADLRKHLARLYPEGAPQ